MRKNPIIFIIAVAFGCNDNPKISIPEDIQNLENLTVYSLNEEPEFTLNIEKDTVFGETENIKFGVIDQAVVDKFGRVYIADIRMMVLNVFDSDGKFIKSLGGVGKGPGEFSSYVGSVQIRGDYLYAFDPSPSRLLVFDIKTLKGINTIIIGENKNSFPDLTNAFPMIEMVFARTDSTYIAKYNKHSRDVKPWDNVETTGLLYHVDESGSITKEVLTYMSEIRTVNGLVINYEQFFSKKHVIMSDDNQFYMADPNNFLVKQFSDVGEYERAFYYPLVNYKLTEESAIKSGIHEKIINNMHHMDLPEFWPIVTDMLIDDQNHLWVATTVADVKVYGWWVVKTSGELVARFDWPRNKPIKYIDNGNFYTKETDEESGLQQIVRYKIEVN